LSPSRAAAGTGTSGEAEPDEERDYESNIVDIYVHYLRRKIERRGDTPLMQAVPGIAYMLKA
jgi:DNA-binding response OmpR family regulator